MIPVGEAAIVGFEGALLLILLGGAAVVPVIVWRLQRQVPLASDIPSRLDPILGRRDRVAIHDTDPVYFAMPEHLTTRDEMVAWMKDELPKLTAAATRSGS